MFASMGPTSVSMFVSPLLDKRMALTTSGFMVLEATPPGFSTCTFPEAACEARVRLGEEGRICEALSDLI